MAEERPVWSSRPVSGLTAVGRMFVPAQNTRALPSLIWSTTRYSRTSSGHQVFSKSDFWTDPGVTSPDRDQRCLWYVKGATIRRAS